MDRFNKRYRLEVQARQTDDYIIIKSPFTLDFNIQKNNMMGANMATFQVYNLKESSRERIRKDRQRIDYRPIVRFYSGYGEDLVETYVGTIKECSSTKSGNNIITTIVAFDNGEAFRAISERNYKKGTPKNTILNDLIGDLKPFGIEKGYVPIIEGSLIRGNSINGKTLDIISKLSNDKFFISDMKAYILGDFETLPSSVRSFNADSGLIGSPRREEAYIYFDVFFEPRIKMGQEIVLKSRVNKYLNGSLKIVSISHSGTISGSVASDAITTLGGFLDASSSIYKRVVI